MDQWSSNFCLVAFCSKALKDLGGTCTHIFVYRCDMECESQILFLLFAKCELHLVVIVIVKMLSDIARRRPMLNFSFALQLARPDIKVVIHEKQQSRPRLCFTQGKSCGSSCLLALENTPARQRGVAWWSAARQPPGQVLALLGRLAPVTKKSLRRGQARPPGARTMWSPSPRTWLLSDWLLPRRLLVRLHSSPE
jgi:hypothetical protein